MKCITICQPYAHLIITPQDLLKAGDVQKRCENRTWPTDYRGWLLIHAGKSRAWLEKFDLERYPNMVFGAIVGMVKVVDCVEIERPETWRDRYPWLLNHPHAEGPWGHIYDGAVRFDRPVPWRGALGLFEVNDEDLILHGIALPQRGNGNGL
jgi:hypothetical protein